MQFPGSEETHCHTTAIDFRPLTILKQASHVAVFDARPAMCFRKVGLSFSVGVVQTSEGVCTWRCNERTFRPLIAALVDWTGVSRPSRNMVPVFPIKQRNKREYSTGRAHKRGLG
jgi:hypothetical protein